MYFIYTIILCLLASGGHAQARFNSKIPISNTKPAIFDGKILHKTEYTYKTVTLNSNYTIFDDLNHDIFSPGVGDIVETKHNDSFQWSIQHISNLAHIVGYRNSAKYIYFPEVKDGAVATLSEDAATLFNAVLTPNIMFNFTATIVSPGTGPLMWTVEAYSASDPRNVLKLRKPASEKARQDFVLKKASIQDN
ncbi:hypothetical protein FQN49_006268 [Arthroderma sp. PD_2]|nr:hypothetical protein FQN49_006268 [Arthroderma sp. PD_2]